jgi:hypothetical protein
MRIAPHRIITLLSSSLLIALSACGILGGAVPEATPTPLPTSSIQGLKVVAPRACLAGEQAMIRVEQPQGDLVAWSPISDTVAYVGSTTESTWNVGELRLVSAAQFDSPKNLASQAAGDLAWSPDGKLIAYLSLRRSDNLYTVGVADPSSRTTRDLFTAEAARTDSYASQKAILGWPDEDHLEVLSSCGLNCMQKLDFNIITGSSLADGNPIQRSRDLWSVTLHHLDVLPPNFASLAGQLNWSPDESLAAYIDSKGRAWIVDAAAGTLYALDISPFGTALETDWSPGGKYLAVRVDQLLKIYAFECK